MQLLLIFGPPAAGKMSVGREIAGRSGFHLFHNHHTIEPLIEVFGYGTPPFETLNLEFRRRVIEEAAGAGLDLVFTFVWGLADPADTDYVEQLIAPYLDAGGRLSVVELATGLAERLVRNRGAERLAAKPTKRDLAWSEAHLRELESAVMNTDPTGQHPTVADAFLSRHRHLRVDNTALTAAETAAVVLDWLAAAESTPSSG